MAEGKKLKSVDGETPLPEVMIQHIQSFLSGKEAARTTILSKAWYTAWSTRPTLDFDPNDFRNDPKSSEIGFAEYAMKSLQRYQDSNLKIDSFKLHMHRYRDDIIEPIANELIVKAMKLGATDLNLAFCSNRSILPREVLESETLVRLSVSRRTIRGSFVKCWRLKSLVLNKVHMICDDMFRDIISCCKLLEELSITDRNNKMFGGFSGVNMFELHKLRHLYLERVVVDPLFFTNFASRFPCLKNLSLVCCTGTYSMIQISSSSLEHVRIEVLKYGKPSTVELDVPNLVYFSYDGDKDMPSLRIHTSREWESRIIIRPSRPSETSSLYIRLKKLLSQLSPSKNSLSMNVGQSRSLKRVYVEGVIEAVPEPLVVQNLTIDPPFASGYTLLIGLFKICRPKFLTIYWSSYWHWSRKDEFIVSILYKRLMKEMISPNCGIPDQDIFGQIGLKEVSVDVYKQIRETKYWEAIPMNEGLDAALTTPTFVGMFRFNLRWGRAATTV